MKEPINEGFGKNIINEGIIGRAPEPNKKEFKEIKSEPESESGPALGFAFIEMVRKTDAELADSLSKLNSQQAMAFLTALNMKGRTPQTILNLDDDARANLRRSTTQLIAVKDDTSKMKEALAEMARIVDED